MVFDATGCSALALDQASFSQLNMERRPLPTFSIGCWESRSRSFLHFGLAGFAFGHEVLGEGAVLDVRQSTRFISALVSAVIRRGPLT